MKSFRNLTEGAIKAEDYEAAIVMGFYNLTKRPITSNPEKYGISQKVFDNINSNPAALEAGNKIAKYVLKTYPSLKKSNAEQYGRAKASLTKFWKSYGASDITPKTDVLIGDKRFSVKIGLAQLMSGGKSESTATFEAAVKNSSKSLKRTKQYTKVVAVLEGFVTNTLAPSQLRPIIKAGKNKVVNKAEAAHKNAMVELGKLFDKSEQFKIEFAREAMSGFEKFGKGSNAAAELMLVSTSDGGKTVIHSVNDDDYCTKIANAMRLQARFKTSSRKIKGEKTGEYNFWSVISLIVNSMEESLWRHNGEELNEIKFFDKVKKFVGGLVGKVRNFFTKGVSQLKTFLGAEPDISVKRKIKF